VTWRFWVDVGGTFTDCLGSDPNGQVRQFKTLSSGITRGRATVSAAAPGCLIAQDRASDPDGFWNGSLARIRAGGNGESFETRVVRFEANSGVLELAEHCPVGSTEVDYELDCQLPAPVIGIRWLLGLSADEACPAVEVRLGTTRGTNALLTRTGAPTVLVTTAGFGDVPYIGNQARPDLFAIDIHKPDRLFRDVIEVQERIAADGTVLTPLDGEALREELRTRRESGYESVAICLMHAWANGEHEQIVARVAGEVGFDEVSCSSTVTPLIRFVPRCDTTCLDAYLNPILRSYLHSIQQLLPGCRLHVMSSTGGLVEADKFRGRDCLLSGPAGGIVGFAAAATAAGFDQAIGFDMGGTSTDVARFDGAFEFEAETIKAGVRVMSPMLAIETVAAGGGSICGFDGGRLFVGPQSAGADPGPACYGGGGPLTVTDMNVFLGRIPVEHFPFPLDVDVVHRQLDTLLEQVNAASPERMFSGREALAEGLLAIANDNMVQAIRRISVAKGFDPSDHVLVCFGGAGGQHACSVARALKIRTVLIHPLSGVLSAWGIGQADVRIVKQRSVLLPLNQDSLSQLQSDLDELERTAIDEVLTQGIGRELLMPSERSYALRYRGTDSSLQVSGVSVQELREDFETQHRRLFGYDCPERAIEIAELRVDAVGRPLAGAAAWLPPAQEQDAESAVPQTVLRMRSVFNGRNVGATVYPRSAIEPGDELFGPAILCEATSTVVIEPGCHLQILDDGGLQITVDIEEDTSPSQGAQQPILLELLSNQFTSIAEQMGATLRRTAISTNVRERLDYSCAVFDVHGRLVVNAPHVPVHLGAMQDTVQAVIAEFPDMQPGDVFITNHPWRGGSHLPDVTVVTPVFVDDHAAFFVANRAHHAEIGGRVPGSMPPFSRTLAEEGVLIPPRRLVSAGVSLESELRDLLVNADWPSRTPDENLADMAAQAAANACGARLLQSVCQRYSLPVVANGMQRIQQAAAGLIRNALQAIPDGRYHFADSLDDMTPVCVTIDVQGDEATIDFHGTGAVHPGNLNANRSIVTAAVLYTFRCLLQDDVPLNAGVLQPLKLIIPPGLLSPAADTDDASLPAVAGGNVETSQRVVDVLFGALKLAAASQGTMNNLTFGDQTFGYYETICGGAGGTATANGADAVHTHMTNTRLTDPELLEQRYPVRLRRFAIRQNSGGSGRHSGGNGVTREIEFLSPMTVSMLSQRRTMPPFGLEGGNPGKPGSNRLLRNDGTEEQLPGVFSCEVVAGDCLQISTPGGGGYGQ
jgi:5-oxoprolinase (ATP-hydrolysing)